MNFRKLIFPSFKVAMGLTLSAASMQSFAFSVQIKRVDFVNQNYVIGKTINGNSIGFNLPRLGANVGDCVGKLQGLAKRNKADGNKQNEFAVNIEGPLGPTNSVTTFLQIKTCEFVKFQ